MANLIRSKTSNLHFYFTQRRSFNFEQTSRYVLTHDMLRETQISLGYINKVFCSKWLSNRQVIFGTKCNKVRELDTNIGDLKYNFIFIHYLASGVRR